MPTERRPVMRAFVLTGPGAYEVQELPAPVAGPGEAVVDIDRVGVCGTDAEFFTGAMAYLHQGHSAYPMRPGHEWAGRVAAVGDGVDPAWLGRRVMGDTMLGCGSCRRCRRGRRHVCERRREVGIRGDLPGALAEQLAVRASSLHALPDSVDAVLGALVEPGGNALRATRAAKPAPGDRALVLGPGTIGLLTAMFLRASGAEVHLLATTESSLPLPGFRARVDAGVRAGRALRRGGRRLERRLAAGAGSGAGRARGPSRVHRAGRRAQRDRHPHARPQGRDATGVLSASPGLDATIRAYAAGTVDPRPLVAATVGLDSVGPVLAGERPAGSGPGPKIHVQP